jgi:CRP/FNR family cyclic AMP-dependent transcriptional regulator
MIQRALPTEAFKERLHSSLERERLDLLAIRRVAKHQPVYMCGDAAESVYIIESGRVKLLMLSPEGKECLLAIYTSGDIFGELSLTGADPRQETAMAMEDTTLKRIPFSSFVRHLSRNALVEGFVDYLAARVADQQHLIANLITVDSKHRLGETLLFLAHKLGQPDSRNTRIELKITHEELSQMVGTTRPRITKFMRAFRALDLIEITPDHFLIVNERKLSEYLAQPG